MISRLIKFLSLKIFLFFLLVFPVVAGSKIVDGKAIKSQAHDFFSENNTLNCSKLLFSPKK